MKKIILYQNKETKEQRYREVPTSCVSDWVVGKTITDENGVGKWEIIEAFEVDKKEVPKYEKMSLQNRSKAKTRKEVQPRMHLQSRESLNKKRDEVINTLVEAGPQIMTDNNVDFKDFELRNIALSLTQLIVNGKSIFVRIKKLKKDNAFNLFLISLYIRDEVESLEIKFSPIDTGYNVFISNNEIVLEKEDLLYTLDIIDSANFDYIFSRVVKAKAFRNKSD